MPPLRFFRELMPFHHVQPVGSFFHQPAEFFAHFRQLARCGLGVQVVIADVLEFGLVILSTPLLISSCRVTAVRSFAAAIGSFLLCLQDDSGQRV